MEDGANTRGLMPPWKPGQSGNPNGRPKVSRPPSVALAELNDAPGDTPEQVVENFKVARRGKLVAADHKAIAMFLASSDPDRRTHVSAFDSSTDRLEGKVTQPINQETNATVRFVFGAPDAPVADEGDPE